MAVLRGPGAPLPPNVRASMEPRFGTDFGSVRIHADGEATRSAEAVNARAYTFGQHIVFARGAYAPDSDAGRALLAHELTHVIQQHSGVQRLQRAVTRGAGGCAAPEAVDEDERGPRGAGILAHTQIQSFLLPRIDNEVEIPRATKRAIGSTGCQPEGVEYGLADLYLRHGATHEIAEIKPYRNDMTHAVSETDHYIRRAGQSMDRFFGAGALCPSAARGADDVAFARRVGISRLDPSFARMTGILASDTVIGRFIGDPDRTLKARLHSPGAVGYWCTGGQSDSFSCGVSDAEIQQYIDRVALGPAEAALDQFLRENVERQLERLLQAQNLGDILALAERHFGRTIRAQLRPYLGPLADSLISRASAQEIGRLIEEAIGPEARAIVTTLVRRLAYTAVAELRVQLRSALSSLIREALLALCVGAPVVTLVELMDRLRQSFRNKALELVPVVATALAARFVQAITVELAAMLEGLVAALGRALDFLGEVLRTAGEILLRVLAVVAFLLLVAGVVIAGVLALVALLDPVPGDEAALAAAAVALASLIPLVGRYILTGSTEEASNGT